MIGRMKCKEGMGMSLTIGMNTNLGFMDGNEKF